MLPRICHIPEEPLHSRGTTVPGPSQAPESCGKPRHSEPAENPHEDWGETRRIQLEKSWKTSAVVAVGTHCLCICPIMTCDDRRETLVLTNSILFL